MFTCLLLVLSVLCIESETLSVQCIESVDLDAFSSV